MESVLSMGLSSYSVWQSLHAECHACMTACTMRAQVDALEAALSDGAAALLGFCHNDLQARRSSSNSTHPAGYARPVLTAW